MAANMGATEPQDASDSRFGSIREIAAGVRDTVIWLTTAAMIGTSIGLVTNPRPLKTPVKKEVKQEWVQDMPSQDYMLDSDRNDLVYDMDLDEIREGMDEGERFRGYDVGDISGIAPRFYSDLVDPEPFTAFAEEIYEQYDTDRERVAAVWEFVGDNVTYESDDSLSVDYLPDDTPLHPMETLYNEAGDCEDMSILNASILEAMPADWDVTVLTVDADSPEDIDHYFDTDHAVVHVDTGEYETVVEAVSSLAMEPYNAYDRVEAYSDGDRVSVEL